MGTTSKALTLLDHFTRSRPQIGLSDLARLSGTNKATCFRLMTELVSHGLVEQVPVTKEYRIGPAVLRLAALREAVVPLREAAQPILQTLATETGETTHLSQLIAGRLVTLAHAYAASSGIQVMMDDADVLPFHATSSGQATLAWLPEPERAAILAVPLPAITPDTPTTAEALRDLIARTRARGWASIDGGFETQVSSLAVPLFDARGQIQGAMAVAAPSARLDDDRSTIILARLIPAARAAMALWGGQIPPELHALWRDH